VAVLYIIGTPIGNLGDLSFRALETLKTAGLVACEDTRRTLKLLSHIGVSVKMISCRAQNEERAAARVIAALDAGETVAYASDAGTPGLSDPGALLVRRAAAAGHVVAPVPGPSAFAALVSVAGGLDKGARFEGFLSPRAGRRRARLRELMTQDCAVVLCESPFRVVRLLEDVAGIDPGRYVCVGREMTKAHEEYLRGAAGDLALTLAAREATNEAKGEFAVYISAGCADNKAGRA